MIIYLSLSVGQLILFVWLVQGGTALCGGNIGLYLYLWPYLWGDQLYVAITDIWVSPIYADYDCSNIGLMVAR